MTGVLIAILQVLACLGLGASLLKGMGILENLGSGEGLAWSFAFGLGGLGWLLFFFGVLNALSPPALGTVLILATAGNVFLFGECRRVAMTIGSWRPSVWAAALLAAVAVIFFFDILEGIAPPIEADSLTYHFAMPKRFLVLGGLEFVPRAIDGAVPLLVQMTYVPALGLGGELGLTLWTMVSGWAMAGLLFTACRRHLSVERSLAAAVVLLTTPAVIYGAGSGQVEIRVALFATLAALCVGRALETGDLRHALAAGIAVGFFMGAKYTGLLFAVACGATILMQRRWFAHGLALTAASIFVGSQWYVWNWAHTGDPVFPMLFETLKDVVDYRNWDAAHAELLKTEFFDQEKAVAVNPLWFVLLPFLAGFADIPELGPGRVGFGPLAPLLIPFVVGGIWLCRRRLRASTLVAPAAVVAVFYALWFFTGTSQKIRHLLPVYPLFLVCAFAAASRFSENTVLVRPFVAALAVTATLQLGSMGLFSIPYVERMINHPSRAEFLNANVSEISAFTWINANLTQENLLLTRIRQLGYLLDTPYLFGHSYTQNEVDLRLEALTAINMARQLQARGITHVHVPGEVGKSRRWVSDLLASGCAEILVIIPITKISSRILRMVHATSTDTHRIIWLNPGKCASLAQ